MLALQAALIIASTRITTRVNNTAVATEIIGIAGLTVLLLIVAAVRSMGHWSNLGATGAVPHLGYYKYLGPFMLATLLGAYTIVGFESASNLAEETRGSAARRRTAWTGRCTRLVRRCGGSPVSACSVRLPSLTRWAGPCRTRVA